MSHCAFGLRSPARGGRSPRFAASVFSLHEQRTGRSSRLRAERRWRAGGLFTIITRSRGDVTRPTAGSANGAAAWPSATRYIWKAVTSSRRTGGRWGEGLPRGFSICSPEAGQ